MEEMVVTETKPDSKVRGDDKSILPPESKFRDGVVNSDILNMLVLQVYRGRCQGWCQHSAAEPLPPSSSSPGQNLHDQQRSHLPSRLHALKWPACKTVNKLLPEKYYIYIEGIFYHREQQN